ncbi:hypothetical protein ACTXOU_14585 [Psychrobacter glacincola]|jgi:hypothetical protein
MNQEVDKVEPAIDKSNEVKKDRNLIYIALRFIGDNAKTVLIVTYGLGATVQVFRLGAIDPEPFLKFV